MRIGVVATQVISDEVSHGRLAGHCGPVLEVLYSVKILNLVALMSLEVHVWRALRISILSSLAGLVS